ncbi:hypothetical protein B7P43_G04585 [Cryptotermes secundus]|uniref:Mos1 transposase HTH domain-containing protein n=1 Tax=Cryptotermes secundus TaxID=105785 RepID=A0A2J7PID3_9NEOP|nr:hypothetical protein B7P43_G04585 [Cryptotermes secundus]
MSAAEIHCELYAVYGQNVTSEGIIRQWCRMFTDGRTDVHDEERNGRTSVVSDDLFKVLTKKFVKDEASQFQNFHVNFSRNDFAPSDYHLRTYLKNCLGSQRFSNNEELIEDVKTWLSSQAVDFFVTGIPNLLPDTSSSIPAVTT